MDIKVQPKKKPMLKKYWYIAAGVSLIAGAFWFRQLFGGISYVVDTNLLRVAEVQRDEFFVDVRSNGELNAREFHWLPAEVEGQVESIFVKAGDQVDIGTPLVQLRSVTLLAEMQNAEWAYKQAVAEANASLRSLESDLLQLEAEALRAQLAYQGNLLKMQAERRLIDQGKGIVSDVEHKRTVFSVKEQLEISQFFEKRMAKMQENLTAHKLASDARIVLLKNELERTKLNVELLTVRSRSKGLVQQMDLQLGQKLIVGDTVARVADTTQLIAELQVQELQVQRVEIGQDVTIDTRKNKLKGKVIRIAPSVNNGMVRVDVDFIDPLPAEARIALSIEGSIRTDSMKDALFVQRPAYIQPNSTVGIYKLDSKGMQAKRIPVQLGLSSVNYVQVLDGLQEGEQIIISDTSAYAEHETILLN